MKSSTFHLPDALKHEENLSKICKELAEETIDSAQMNSKWNQLVEKSLHVNPWFTRESINSSLTGLSLMLELEDLQNWYHRYSDLPRPESKRVGMVLAGNIPFVGFHDVFCAAIAGHSVVAKCSVQDQLLLPALMELFYQSTNYKGFDVEWVKGKMPEIDAMIATGSNNTSRYFEYYFSSIPHIIRKNRSAVAMLTGRETEEDLRKLGPDILSYFGLGCRNVSKIYVHDDFEIDRFFKAIYDFHPIINHHKYANNYDYYRALWMLNREDLLDNGFLILRPSEAIASPIATVFYERYSSESELRTELKSRAKEIQCIVSLVDVPFGLAQRPRLWDYADGIDTMKFLLTI